MTDSGGSGVAVATVVTTLGGVMVYSALKGQSVADVLAGAVGAPLNPKGGDTTPVSTAPPIQDTTGLGGSAGLGTPMIGGLPAGVAAKMETEMDRMIGLHQPYSWGGGHSRFSMNGPWDCSGAMSWLMHAMGLLTVNHPITSTGFMAQGEPGRGKVFTIYANPTHVFLVMETGPHAGRSWGTTSRLPSAGGSLQWHTHTTAGFVPRHYPGF